MKEHIVRLTDEARQQLQQLVQSGTRAIRVVRRALILLKSDEGLTDDEIVEHIGCGERTVRSVRKRFCTAGLEAPCTMRRGAAPRRASARDSSKRSSPSLAANRRKGTCGGRWNCFATTLPSKASSRR